jgi:hypothetical protein
MHVNCVASHLLLLYQILQNRPTQSRKTKILAQNVTSGVTHKYANRWDTFPILQLLYLKFLNWDYFKINNYNWERAEIAGTGKQRFFTFMPIETSCI